MAREHVDRRLFLSLACASAAHLALTGQALGELVCGSTPAGQSCDARILSSRFASVRAVQRTLVWCWAATLEMIFRWHGRSISQESIVVQTFGTAAVVQANPIVLINAINRTYRDDSGAAFQVRARVWGPDYQMAQIDNGTLINSLSRDRPLVVCNMSHMMVLIGMNYLRYPNGMVEVRQAWVADPMLIGQVTNDLAPGFRYLQPAEMIPMTAGGQLRFAADLDVS